MHPPTRLVREYRPRNYFLELAILVEIPYFGVLGVGKEIVLADSCKERGWLVLETSTARMPCFLRVLPVYRIRIPFALLFLYVRDNEIQPLLEWRKFFLLFDCFFTFGCFRPRYQRSGQSSTSEQNADTYSHPAERGKKFCCEHPCPLMGLPVSVSARLSPCLVDVGGFEPP